MSLFPLDMIKGNPVDSLVPSLEQQQQLVNEGCVSSLKPDFVASCLALEEVEEDPAEQNIEILGRLLGWWKLIRRCFGVTCIFDHLHSAGNKRKKGGTRLSARERYTMFLKKTLGAERAAQCVLYSQAARLDRLGRLLKEFPALAFQVQFVTVRDWYERWRWWTQGTAFFFHFMLAWNDWRGRRLLASGAGFSWLQQST